MTLIEKRDLLRCYDPANGMTCMQFSDVIEQLKIFGSYDPANGMTCMQYCKYGLGF